MTKLVDPRNGLKLKHAEGIGCKGCVFLTRNVQCDFETLDGEDAPCLPCHVLVHDEEVYS